MKFLWFISREIINIRLTIDEELQMFKEYMIDFCCEHSINVIVLGFWKKYYSDLPILSHMPRSYLSTLGTSISSECALSRCVYVKLKKRIRLSLENFDQANEKRAFIS